MYDFFTFDGRRMGAHAGSSSSDLFLYCGFKRYSSSLFFILSKEIHGIKSMTNPEIKREISILYQKEISKKSSIMINFENEHISNFQFYSSRYSKSNLFWIGYSYTIGNMLR